MSSYATIVCDVEETSVGRCMSEGTTLALSSTATVVRDYLRGQGWHRTRDGRDICPDCWAAGSR
jgi:hypothetical protein